MTTPDPAAADLSGVGLNPFRPRVLYSAYRVRDIDVATAFYVGVLGMKEHMRFELPSGEWECVLRLPGAKSSGVILMWRPGKDRPRTHGDAYSRLILEVSDLDAAVERLRSHGTPITTEPTQAPIGVRYAMCVDPDGYTLELMQLP